jgi:predicted nucleotidyltransferase component of viral defense system
MSNKEIKDVAQSVLVRLKNQAKSSGISYQMGLQLFFQEEFLRRLSISKYNESFILKGGMFIYTLTNFKSRATQDIDFLMCRLSNDLDNISSIMENIVSVETENSYITFKVLGTSEITPDKEYHGVNVKLCGYIKNVKVPFSIDIGIDDVVVPNPVRRSLVTRLEEFNQPLVYTYSLESTIAEKFDAILKRMEITSRMKDFFDIYYLSNMYEFDGKTLQQAILETIQHRKTPYDIDSFNKIVKFKENTFLNTQWINYSKSLKMDLPSFNVVINEIETFLKPIFDSIVNNIDFTQHWDNLTHAWK